MSEITSLEPRLVWEQFDAITRVPRPSKKEGKIIDFLVDFAKKHHIEYKKDAIGNVVMRKPATPGMEERAAVILQSHMDMVCEKNSDVEFDFDNDPIRTRIDGEWVRAEGTTLGADCGIGMAAALAVMLDETVEHGPVEALFTVDEETGLTGAFELGEEMLTGKYLVNLDSEDEGEIFIGCAGGIDTIATFHYTMEPSPKNYTFFRVDVSDLQGGHSGDDIDNCAISTAATSAMPFPARLTPSSAFRPASRRSSSSVTTFSPRTSKPNSASANPISKSRSTRCPTSTRCSTAGRSRRWSTRWWAFPTGSWPCRSPFRGWSRPRRTSLR